MALERSEGSWCTLNAVGKPLFVKAWVVRLLSLEEVLEVGLVTDGYWCRMKNPNLDVVGQSHRSVVVLNKRWSYQNLDRDRRILSRTLSRNQTDCLK